MRLTALQSLPDWQPVRILATARPIPAIAVNLRERGKAGADLVIYRSHADSIPPVLCPPLVSFHVVTVTLAQGRTATLRAETLPSGGVLQELDWSDGNERTVMRFAGRTVQLLSLAKLLTSKTP